MLRQFHTSPSMDFSGIPHMTIAESIVERIAGTIIAGTIQEGVQELGVGI